MELAVNILCALIALASFYFLARYVYLTSLLNEEKVRNQNPCAVWIARVLFAGITLLSINHLLEIV